MVKANHTFEKVVVTARPGHWRTPETGRWPRLAERPGHARANSSSDIVQNIPEGEPITYFKNGDFIDLCAGPHVMRTGNIGAFKLTTVASAYYKGDEKNPQLQRIYGTAFKNKTEMEAYFTMLEEAKRRDHRKIGQEMGLFAMDAEYVGPGLPLWLPKGTAIVEELEKLAKETEFAAGYVRVKTPHIAQGEDVHDFWSSSYLRGFDVSADEASFGGGRCQPTRHFESGSPESFGERCGKYHGSKGYAERRRKRRRNSARGDGVKDENRRGRPKAKRN